MPAGNYLTEFERGQITGFSESGKSHREIAQLINRSKTVVTNYLAKKENYGIKKPTKGNSKLTRRDKSRIFREVRTNKMTSTKLKTKLNLDVTPRAIRKVLSADSCIKFAKMKSKPLLTNVHKKPNQ